MIICKLKEVHERVKHWSFQPFSLRIIAETNAFSHGAFVFIFYEQKREHMYKESRNYENVQKAIFAGEGKYQIPKLEPVHYEGCDFIGFNYASSTKEREDKGIHFFLDDYQFTRLWTKIDTYIPMLQQYKYVLTPDYSLFTDFPKALQIYNHFRKHWIGAYMQMHGITVIPTIGWSDQDSFEWCFDGEPVGGCVAVSSVGCMQNKESRAIFIEGYREMMKRIKPTQIIFYGIVPDECEGNIINVDSFSTKFKKG